MKEIDKEIWAVTLRLWRCRRQLEKLQGLKAPPEVIEIKHKGLKKAEEEYERVYKKWVDEENIETQINESFRCYRRIYYTCSVCKGKCFSTVYYKLPVTDYPSVCDKCKDSPPIGANVRIVSHKFAPQGFWMENAWDNCVKCYENR